VVVAPGVVAVPGFIVALAPGVVGCPGAVAGIAGLVMTPELVVDVVELVGTELPADGCGTEPAGAHRPFEQIAPGVGGRPTQVVEPAVDEAGEIVFG
jgi:hypothetical protein